MAATNINRVVLTGNLTRDPELRSTPGGTSVCSLRVACNTRRKDASGEWVDKPNYFDVTVWGAQGENCAQYLSKGRPVAVDGRLEWREWEDKEGNKRQSIDIIADSVQFLGSRGDGGENGGRFTPQSDVPADTADFETGACGRRLGRRHPVLAGAPGATGGCRCRASGRTAIARLACRMAKQRGNTQRDSRRRRDGRKGPPGGGRRKSCPFCRDKVDVGRLQGPRRAAPRDQRQGQDPLRRASRAPAAATSRQLARAVKRAREVGLLPYVGGRARPMAQAILLKDVDTLGERGDVIDVAPGYLRNFLVPRKLAQPATPASIAEAQRRHGGGRARRRRRPSERARGDRRAAAQDRPHHLAPGRRRRAPVRLGHGAARSPTRSSRRAASSSTAARSASTSRSRRPARTWSPSRSHDGVTGRRQDHRHRRVGRATPGPASARPSAAPPRRGTAPCRRRTSRPRPPCSASILMSEQALDRITLEVRLRPTTSTAPRHALIFALDAAAEGQAAAGGDRRRHGLRRPQARRRARGGRRRGLRALAAGDGRGARQPRATTRGSSRTTRSCAASARHLARHPGARAQLQGRAARADRAGRAGAVPDRPRGRAPASCARSRTCSTRSSTSSSGSRARALDVTGTPSGFTDLDDLTGGFQPGNLIVLAAQAVDGQVRARHQHRRERRGRLRQAGRAVLARDVRGRARPALHRLAGEASTATSCARAASSRTAGRRCSRPPRSWPRAPLYVDDSSDIGILEIRAKARRLHARSSGGLGLLIVDYLQLMRPEDSTTAASSRSARSAAGSRSSPASWRSR